MQLYSNLYYICLKIYNQIYNHKNNIIDKYKKLNDMQAISNKVRNKYRKEFSNYYGSIKAFAEWSGLHYQTARCFRTQYVIDKADQFLAIMKEKEKQLLKKL